MFFRLYYTRLKCLSRDYSNLFWSFGFTILLSIFFYMGYYNINSNEVIDTIPIGVVTQKSADDDFLTSLENIKISSEEKLFQVKLCSLEDAKKLLNDSKVEGYIVYNNSPILYIKENGLEETIIKSFIDSYLQMNQTANSVISINPDALNQGLTKEIATYKNYIFGGDKEAKNPNYTLICFYSLIAMACMFGTKWGFSEMVDIQADQSIIGARINIAPIHKIKLLMCNLMAAFTLHFASILLLLFFMDNVLKIEFGGQLWMILLISFMGSLCGIFMGAMICVTIKANIKVREAVMNAIVLGGGFLSGMMLVQMKYIIATKAPLLAYLNPTNLITDAFYSLYYYEGYAKVIINMGVLGLLTILFGLVTYIKIRRRDYASI